jgi:hypothetical protein
MVSKWEILFMSREKSFCYIVARTSYFFWDDDDVCIVLDQLVWLTCCSIQTHHTDYEPLHSDTSYWLWAAPFRHIILTMSHSIQTHHTDYEPLHSDTSYWLWAKFLLLLLKAYCRSIKYHYYNLWFDKNQGSNPRSTILKAITLSITSTRPIL